jgi:pimeloyl-ACP methyl ester carboxylesterase
MEFQESFFDTGEVLLHYFEGPQAGPAMVLLHGATGSAMEWMNVIPHFAARWHVFAVDLRGHGLSGRPKSREGYHISRNVKDILAFLLHKVRAPAVLVGHSYGAVISILTPMHARDSVRAVVLEDPPLLLHRVHEPDNSRPDYFGWVYQMRQSAHTFDQILTALAEQNPQAPLDSLRPWAQNLAWLDPDFALALSIGDRRETVKDVDFTTHVQGIACPALLLQADPASGGAMPQQDVEFFMENAPDARLVFFPGVGHGIHTDQPDAYLRAVDGFADFNTSGYGAEAANHPEPS